MLEPSVLHAQVSIRRNKFYLIGGSGVVLWGHETNGDGTDGNQPRQTHVAENFCHEIGIYQKQSSCYFHAVSAQSTVVLNLFFNGPRKHAVCSALHRPQPHAQELSRFHVNLGANFELQRRFRRDGELQRRFWRWPRSWFQPHLQFLVSNACLSDSNKTLKTRCVVLLLLLPARSPKPLAFCY